MFIAGHLYLISPNSEILFELNISKTVIPPKGVRLGLSVGWDWSCGKQWNKNRDSIVLSRVPNSSDSLAIYMHHTEEH